MEAFDKAGCSPLSGGLSENMDLGPFRWTPDQLGERSSRCRLLVRLIHRSAVSRWSGWSDRDEDRRAVGLAGIGRRRGVRTTVHNSRVRAAADLAGPRPTTCAPVSCSMPSTWRSGNANPTASSITPIREGSTPRSPSATAAASPACVRSTGSIGDCYDNAVCESFFATLECDLLDRRRFRSHAKARMPNP